MFLLTGIELILLYLLTNSELLFKETFIFNIFLVFKFSLLGYVSTFLVECLIFMKTFLILQLLLLYMLL